MKEIAFRKLVREEIVKLHEGYESHIDAILSDAGLNEYDWHWSYGTMYFTSSKVLKMAKEILEKRTREIYRIPPMELDKAVRETGKNINEWTLSDVEIAMKRADLTHDAEIMKQRLRQRGSVQNITLDDLVAVGLATRKQGYSTQTQRELWKIGGPKESVNEAKRTPWGIADHVEEIGKGILSVSTPSHGGYYVPNNLLSKIDPAGRAYAKKWSGSENWYEEDIGWAWVVVAFPELFKERPGYSGENIPHAKDIVKRYGPGGERYSESVNEATFRYLKHHARANEGTKARLFGLDLDENYRVEASTVYNGRSWRTSPIEMVLYKGESALKNAQFKNRRLAEMTMRAFKRALKTENRKELKRIFKEDWYVAQKGGDSVTFDAASDTDANRQAVDMQAGRPKKIEEAASPGEDELIQRGVELFKASGSPMALGASAISRRNLSFQLKREFPQVSDQEILHAISQIIQRKLVPPSIAYARATGRARPAEEATSADQWEKRKARWDKWKKENPQQANVKRAEKEKQMPWLRKQKPQSVPVKKEGGPGSGPQPGGARKLPALTKKSGKFATGDKVTVSQHGVTGKVVATARKGAYVELDKEIPGLTKQHPKYPGKHFLLTSPTNLQKEGGQNVPYVMGGEEGFVRELVKRYGKEKAEPFLKARASGKGTPSQLNKYRQQYQAFQKMDAAGLLEQGISFPGSEPGTIPADYPNRKKKVASARKQADAMREEAARKDGDVWYDEARAKDIRRLHPWGAQYKGRVQYFLNKTTASKYAKAGSGKIGENTPSSSLKALLPRKSLKTEAIDMAQVPRNPEEIEAYAQEIVRTQPAEDVLHDGRRYLNRQSIGPTMRKVWTRAVQLARAVGR